MQNTTGRRQSVYAMRLVLGCGNPPRHFLVLDEDWRQSDWMLSLTTHSDAKYTIAIPRRDTRSSHNNDHSSVWRGGRAVLTTPTR